jgi:hypothetical protein
VRTVASIGTGLGASNCPGTRRKAPPTIAARIAAPIIQGTSDRFGAGSSVGSGRNVPFAGDAVRPSRPRCLPGTPERHGKCRPVGEAVVPVFRQRLRQERRKIRRHALEMDRKIARGLVNDAIQHRRNRIAGERFLASEHLVQHDCEREQVGAAVDRLATNLLRGHVIGRTEE